VPLLPKLQLKQQTKKLLKELPKLKKKQNKPMKQDELFRAGKIVRTFGSKGEMLCQFNSDTISLKKLESVFLKLNENLVPFFIESIQPKTRNQAIIKFHDVNSANDAFELAGSAVFLPLSFRPKSKGSKYDLSAIEGFTVIDHVHGEIGTVSSVLELPEQDLLQIDFKGKEILIPVVDEIVKKIDMKNKIIMVEAPEGLIDIYIT
jgi:16S rRNA processing protein RimM